MKTSATSEPRAPGLIEHLGSTSRPKWIVVAIFAGLALASLTGSWAERKLVSSPFHIPYIVALSVACGYAAWGMWTRFRFDSSGQTLLIGAAFAGLGLVFLPHALYAPVDTGSYYQGGGDVAHAFFAPASRFVFGVFLLAAFLRVPIPGMLRNPRVTFVLLVMAFAGVVDVALQGPWLIRTLGDDPGRISLVLELGAITLELCALVLLVVQWRRTHSALLASIGAMTIAMITGGLLALTSDGWELRWWLSHFYLVVAAVIVVMGVGRQLSRAIGRHELVLHYQPKIELTSGEMAGVEALVRWQHPDRGMIPPGEFIELAEQTDLIKPLTIWVLEESLRQQELWLAAGHRIPVAVNVSVCLLHDDRLIEVVRSLVASSTMGPAGLELELTETGVMENPKRALEVIRSLGELGVRLSIDDYGTGYSSLSYIKTLPVEEIKIDKSFIEDLDTDQQNQILTKSTVDLAHDLNRMALAEGVETDAVRQKLIDLGCDQGQGYFWSKPLAADQLRHWLEQRQSV